DGSGPAASVQINGQAVDVLDAAGDFFEQLQIAPGRNAYSIEATNAAGDQTRTKVTIEETQLADGAVDFAHLSVWSASAFWLYSCASWQDATSVLYAECGIKNIGQYAVNGPVLVGVTNIS